MPSARRPNKVDAECVTLMGICTMRWSRRRVPSSRCSSPPPLLPGGDGEGPDGEGPTRSPTVASCRARPAAMARRTPTRRSRPRRRRSEPEDAAEPGRTEESGQGLPSRPVARSEASGSRGPSVRGPMSPRRPTTTTSVTSADAGSRRGRRPTPGAAGVAGRLLAAVVVGAHRRRHPTSASSPAPHRLAPASSPRPEACSSARSPAEAPPPGCAVRRQHRANRSPAGDRLGRDPEPAVVTRRARRTCYDGAGSSSRAWACASTA